MDDSLADAAGLRLHISAAAARSRLPLYTRISIAVVSSVRMY